ncbi:hypothetical protein U1Q18_009349 [Sarracenia purpurea var. burkii]
MTYQAERRFLDFFETWVCQLESYLQLLLSASNGKSKKSDSEALVAKITAHHEDFYTAKWAAAHEDVLAFFVPVWLSPLENANLWITGWKPSMAFQILDSVRRTRVPGASLVDMTENQLENVEALRGKIRLEEEKVEREMERQQVAMADRRMVELARLSSRVKVRGNDEAAAEGKVDGLVEAPVNSLLEGLERVMKMADCVRLKTLKGLLDVLSPGQGVDFLAASSMLQVQIRRWGKKRESNQRDDENEGSVMEQLV